MDIDERQLDPKGRLTAKESYKNGCVADSLNQYQCLLHTIAQLPIVVASSWEEAPTVTGSLCFLNAITIAELIPGKHHYGRVLHGQFCVQPYKDSSVNTVLEDVNGRSVRVIIFNAFSSSASRAELMSCFPLGMRVAIKDPFLEVCVDRTTLVRVDNPADIFCDDGCEGDDSSTSSNVEKVEMIRCEGNCFFSYENWVRALSSYSECIDRAVCITKKVKINQENFNLVKVNRIVMLAYSIRAEARLRLQHYKDALSDANKALEIDSKHVKSLVRKGKAAHGLGLFEQAYKTLKAALELSRPEQSILKNVQAVTDYFAWGCIGDAPSCSDYVGPVEIRRVDYGFGRRGLFTNRRVKAGEILVASNPFAIVRTSSDDNEESTNIRSIMRPRWSFRGAKIRSGLCQQKDIITELADLVLTSKRRMAQLYSLGVYGKVDMEIPSMELFRPGSEWAPPGVEKLQVDVALISDIVTMNSFQKGYTFRNVIPQEEMKVDGGHAAEEVSCAIWLLPSFANHSCAPSCLAACIEETMFFRAARDMEEGEELTIPYFDGLYKDVHSRQKLASRWCFECTCERCLFEQTLEPQISKLYKAVPRLVQAVRDEENGNEPVLDWPAAKALAAVVDKVEAFILSCKVDPRKRAWIRATFCEAYQSKVDLTMQQCDNSKSGKLAVEYFISALYCVILPSGADHLSDLRRAMELRGGHCCLAA